MSDDYVGWVESSKPTSGAWLTIRWVPKTPPTLRSHLTFLVLGLPQFLLAIEILEGLDELTYVSGDDVVELVEGEIDAVVGEAILGEVVGADAVAAVAGADESAALLGAFAMDFLLLHFIKPAAE